MLCLFIYQTTLFVHTYKSKHLLIAALLATFALLIKPVFYPFAIVFGFVSFWFLRDKINLKWIATLLIPTRVACFIILINEQRTGVAHYSSIQRINLLDYNTKYLQVGLYGLEYANQFNDSIKRITTAAPYNLRYQIESEAANQVILDNVTAYGYFHFKGIIGFFLDPGKFDLFNFFKIDKSGEVGFLKIINEQGLSGIWNFIIN